MMLTCPIISPTGIWEWNVISGNWDNMIRGPSLLTREEQIDFERSRDSTFSDWEKRIHPEDRMFVRNEIEKMKTSLDETISLSGISSGDKAEIEISKNPLRIDYRIQYSEAMKNYHIGNEGAPKNSQLNRNRWVWVSDKFQVLEWTSTSKMIFIIRTDINAMKNSEIKLKESEDRYRTITTLAPVGIFEADPKGLNTFSNDCWVCMSGLKSPEEAKGTGWTNGILDEDRERLSKEWYSYVSSQEKQKRFSTLFRFGGEHQKAKTCHAVALPLLRKLSPNSDPVIYKYVGACQDVSESIALKRAEVATQLKSEFLSHMSHEIRTPLHGILGAAELLWLDRNLGAEQKGLTRMIIDCGKNLLALINDILDLSRIESGKLPIVLEVTDIYSCLGEIYSIHGIKAKNSRISLGVFIDENIPRYIVSSSLRIQQILSNLVGNAVKFTEKGFIDVFVCQLNPKTSGVFQTDSIKKIEIENSESKAVDTKRDFSRLISIATRIREREHECKKTKLLFLVVDSGIGIPKNVRISELFNPFSQVEGLSSNYKNKGSGLGLCIAKKLSSLMNGDAWLEESKENHGSVFAFTISYDSEEAEKLNPGKKDSKITATDFKALSTHTEEKFLLPDSITSKFALKYPFKILVAEDNFVNQKLIKKVLLKLGYSGVTIVSNGCEALTEIKKAGALSQFFELVLMDLQMPEMDGYEATESIRNMDTITQPVIIALTANAMQSIKDRCLSIGMDGYLTKPLHIRSLCQLLREKFLKLHSRST